MAKELRSWGGQESTQSRLWASLSKRPPKVQPVGSCKDPVRNEVVYRDTTSLPLAIDYGSNGTEKLVLLQESQLPEEKALCQPCLH